MKSAFINPMLWTLPFGVLGAIVGSFLNVVIYRLPRGLSVAQPRWSFCPACNQRISPGDNIPIFGWLLLRGRCRKCAAAIPNFYPIVECVTFLVFAALWDVLFVSRMSPLPGLLPDDLPICLAFGALFAGLIAGAGMDLESYTIDIRIPLLTTVLAVLCHAFRGLPNMIPGAPAALPPSLVGLVVLGGTIWLVCFLLFGRHTNDVTTDPAASEPSIAPSTPEPPAQTASLPNAALPQEVDSAWPIAVLALISAALMAWIALWPLEPTGWAISGGGIRGIAATCLLLLVLILASMVHRPGDVQIITDIEQERFRARPIALRELAGFLPAILICGGLLYYLRRNGLMNTPWGDLVPIAAWRFWSVHFYGALTALAGALAAAGVGWTVRILGTLAFGKEAFGTGDIYLLAAIGAAGGLWYTIIAFFMAALLALVGVVATSFRKSSRAIPFGPWLGLGAFAALWLEKPLSGFFAPAFSMIWTLICGQHVIFYDGAQA